MAGPANLNQRLQAAMNPEAIGLKRAGVEHSVMQTRNNYENTEEAKPLNSLIFGLVDTEKKNISVMLDQEDVRQYTEYFVEKQAEHHIF